MSIRIRVAALSGLLAVALAGMTGCVRIDGGAVEINWVVHSTEGQAITDCSCTAPAIAWVQLDLQGVDGTFPDDTPCAGKAECRFPCQRQTGSTPFDISPGTSVDGGQPLYAVSVTALGDDLSDLSTMVDGSTPAVQTPAPILRSVVQGQPTEVEVFLLVARCSDECSAANSAGVCTRP
jgi:hypothetical protein